MLLADLPETLDIWVAAWQAAYPATDFATRRDSTAGRIAELERTGPQSQIVTRDGRIVGALVVDPDTGYLDQIVVAIEWQGTGIAGVLPAEARRLSPAQLDLHVNKDNARAIRFYKKNGFVVTGEDVNPRSGAPIYLMTWRSGCAPSNCSLASRA
ncbi:MAG: GNAT family N-acetyltransferase [Rhizobiales bacterium]|nr:GNAT family N-acetyltransferase [Hyphomicrobiales bacterium]